MKRYDVCIIGGGPSGYAAAIRAWDFGKRVCLIERSRLGGAGVFNGALSSKTFWELSRDYRQLTQRDRGYRVKEIELEYAEVARCVQSAVEEKAEQLVCQIEELNQASDERSASIEVVYGDAEFIDSHSLQVKLLGAKEDRRILADYFVIASGSSPRQLDNISVDGERVMSSDHLMSLTRFPESLVIVGAGVIGCEFATIFSNYGQTKVKLIDRKERILPFEDEDIASLCSKNLEAKGVRIHGEAKLLSLDSDDSGVKYRIEEASGKVEEICVERALISVGRVPNTKDLSLERAGVELSAGGHIVSQQTRTSVPHIFAIGDVTLDIALVSIGEIEGRYAIEQIFGQTSRSLRYDNLSTIMFLDPEVAAIGLNETQAQEKGISYRVASYGYGLVNRALAMRSTDGFLKILVTNDEEMKVLGMRALGVHASTTIEAVSLLMQQSRSIRDLAELIHPHPAITEGLQDCVRMLLGNSIYKPTAFPELLRIDTVDYSSPPG